MTTDKNKLTPEMEADLDAIEAALAGNSKETELTDLGRLALELRAERPEPDPFFTRELDAKAAAGFPRSSRSAGSWRQKFSPQLAMGGVASLLIVAVIGVTALQDGASNRTLSDDAGGGGSIATSESAPETDASGGAASGGGVAATGGSDEEDLNRFEAAKRAAQPQAGGGGSTSAGSSAPSSPNPAPALGASGSTGADARQRRVQETSASLTLSAPPERINAVADGVIRVTDQLGGFVVSSTVSSTDGDGGGGLFELRVPSAKLQSALGELSKLAHVSQRQQASQDITAESVSARDRLEDARAERAALLRRLARASTQAEIDATKARLRIVSQRIAAAKADVARVNNRASFSNIAVSLAADPNAGDPGTDDDGQWSPGDAWNDAVRVLEVVAGVALIALAIGLPIALLVTLLVVAARLTARRRRERTLDAV